jgi:hypothetical protein
VKLTYSIHLFQSTKYGPALKGGASSIAADEEAFRLDMTAQRAPTTRRPRDTEYAEVVLVPPIHEGHNELVKYVGVTSATMVPGLEVVATIGESRLTPTYVFRGVGQRTTQPRPAIGNDDLGAVEREHPPARLVA